MIDKLNKTIPMSITINDPLFALLVLNKQRIGRLANMINRCGSAAKTNISTNPYISTYLYVLLSASITYLKF